MGLDQFEQLARSICQSENYQFKAACGEGAFKKTFLVSDGTQDLALKIIVGSIASERVTREIQALKHCDHPNISKLITVGDHKYDGRQVTYIVEEFLPGGTLGDQLGVSLLSKHKGKAFAIAMIDAIDHLASNSIVHRDIKPENVMYRADGAPVLVDLGIARVLSKPSLTQDYLAQGPGTPIYASPEQLVNDKYLIDWRTDQFSLGVTLSIAMLGVHPYSVGDLHPNTIELVSQREGPSEQFNSMAKSSGLLVLKTMVEPWPVKRFRTPQDLRSAWQAIKED